MPTDIDSTDCVCAVIVTYHPTADMVANFFKIRKQVKGLVVVDNGSNADELSLIYNARKKNDFHLIENGDNLGVAEALNIGVRKVKSLGGYSWVIFFDQDSTITDGLVCNMLAAWQVKKNRNLIAAVHPTYINPSSKEIQIIPRAKDGGPLIDMTSGALMPLWAFEKLGMFRSDYFTDTVDDEYSLRIRTAGYQIMDTEQAQLLHESGSVRKIRFLGFSIMADNHNAMRRYYMTRNNIDLFRRYFFKNPKVSTQLLFTHIKSCFKCTLVEGDRARKFRNIMLGIWDGIRGRMGKREGL